MAHNTSCTPTSLCEHPQTNQNNPTEDGLHTLLHPPQQGGASQHYLPQGIAVGACRIVGLGPTLAIRGMLLPFSLPCLCFQVFLIYQGTDAIESGVRMLNPRFQSALCKRGFTDFGYALGSLISGEGVEIPHTLFFWVGGGGSQRMLW